MIDPNTQEELQTVVPTIDEAQSQSDAELMGAQVEQHLQTPQPQEMSETEAGLASDIAKFATKIMGKEVASDVPKEVAPKIKVDGGAMKNIAKKLIEKDKIMPIAKEKPKIGEMVTKSVRQKPTEEVMQTARFDNFAKGNSIVANDINAEKEMLGLRESDIDSFDSNDAWQLNFSTIRDEEDLASTLAYMAEHNQAMIQAERGNAGTDEYILGLAKDIGADAYFIGNVLTWENGGALPSAGYVMAIRQTLDASAVKLRQLAMIPENQMSMEQQSEFLAQYDFHRRFQAKFMGMRAELSRSFRAIGIPYKEDDMANFISQASAGLDIKTLREMISKSETTEGINKLVNAYAGNDKKWKADALYSYYMGSILSGVGTQLLVAFGGASNMMSRIAERKIASYMPSFNSADNVAREEYDIMMAAYRSSFSDGMKAFWKTFTTGEAYKGIGSHGEVAYNLPKPSEQFKLNGPTAMLADGAFNAAQFMMKNVMGGTDAFFRTINERSELMTLAYRQAKNDVELGKVMPDNFESHLKSIIENPTEDMAQKVELFGREIGMQEPSGAIAKKVQELSTEIPGMRYIIPFVNTLTNQVRQTVVERTPLAVLSQKFRDDVLAGGARGQLAATKMAIGTGYLSIAYGLAESGKMTGAYPKDKGARDAWKAAGIQPYSFVYTNDDGTRRYISYQGLEPFATLFGIAATFSDLNNDTMWYDLTKNEDQQFTEFASRMMFAVSETTLNKTFATGLQNFFDAVQSPNQMERLISSIANGMTPFAGARRNITKAFDDVKRDTDGLWDELQSQLPLLSENLTPKLDMFGEEVKHKTNLMRWYPVEATKDPVILELENISKTMGKMAMGEFKDEFGGQTATPQERYRWTKYARKDRRDIDGRSLHDVMYDIIQSDYYKEMTSYDKLRELSSTVKAWDTAALQEVEVDDPELAKKIYAREAAKEALRQIEKEGASVEEAKKNALKMQEEFRSGGF